MDTLRDLLPVLTFILGALAQGYQDSRRDRRQETREEKAFTRQMQREDERAARDFERESLLELQDAVQRYARLVGKTHHAAHVHIRGQGGAPKDLRVPDGLDEDLRQAKLEVQRLVARVPDNDVAGWIDRMIKDSNEATMIGIGGRDLAHADKHMEAFAEEVLEANRSIGRRLRLLIYGSAVR